ncbi:MAG: class I SAM-dependent methyltransferase [Nitrospirae bacterium]|nr:class I SAM-dependent methyltransferase [Nitrospirota bacterium]
MEKALCRRTATVGFWDRYARWYKLWMDHTRYHDRIIEVLTAMAEPGWRVLDIGAGNGVLSLPLCSIGCSVTALEPSTAMRSLLYEQSFARGIDWLGVDDRRWEDVPVVDYRDYDLVMACNSLHLTRTGFSAALMKTFMTGSANVFLVTEEIPGSRIKWRQGRYRMLFGKICETESSFYYHDFQEAYEHWSFKKGRPLRPEEAMEIRSRIVFEDGHLLMKDTACVGMYWWRRQETAIRGTVAAAGHPAT